VEISNGPGQPWVLATAGDPLVVGTRTHNLSGLHLVIEVTLKMRPGGYPELNSDSVACGEDGTTDKKSEILRESVIGKTRSDAGMLAQVQWLNTSSSGFLRIRMWWWTVVKRAKFDVRMIVLRLEL
jgi:hypothetical protein